MKNIDRFVDSIVKGLPLDPAEQDDLREELIGHLTEHVNDLLRAGYSKEGAVDIAIMSFGDGQKIQSEMKKELFPYYKLIRYGICTFAVTVMFCALSYFLTQYYFPRHDPSITVDVFFMLFVICVVVLGVLEVVVELLEQESRRKWFLSPWLILALPAVLIQVSLLMNVFMNPERTAFWIYDDYLFFPLYVIFYIVCRQLFTWVFVRKSYWRKIPTLK